MRRVRITDAQRRARVVARHRLDRTANDALDAVRSLAAVHSSDPITPYLACWARVPEFATRDLDHALYEARTLWRAHALRRTMFVVAADEAPIFAAAVGREVAAKERRRLEQWLAAELPAAVPRRLGGASILLGGIAAGLGWSVTMP